MITPEQFRTALRDSGGLTLEGRKPAPCFLRAARYHFATLRFIAQGSAAVKHITDDKAALYEAFKAAVGVANSVQHFGGSLEISGFQRAAACFDKPAVYVANHMSPLETYLLAGIILGLGDASAVLKTSLLKLPLIGPLLTASRPIALERKDARKDLVQTLEQGQSLIAEGRAIILFPEGTRRPAFEARRFNTLGEKLSARAGVPLVPVAIDTRFQALGKFLADLGPIHPEHTVRIECGEPIPPGLPAKERHAATIQFIQERLLAWGVPVINSEQKDTP